MQYSPKGFQDIASKAKMAPAELQSPLNFANGGLVYNSQNQINDIMASPNGFSGMSNQLNMATGGMVQSEELMQEPSQGLPQYYPVSGEPTQQPSPFATGLMPQDTPPLTPPVAPPSISTPYPARVMGSFSNSPGSNSIAPPLSSVDQIKTISDPAPVLAPTISPVAMAHGGAVGGGRMASTMKAEFSKRGLDFDKYMANRLAAKGHNGDTMLAHINPSEAQMLKQAGGSGRINPDTGLMAFDNPSQGDYGDSNYGSTNYGGLYGGGNGSPSSSSSGYQNQGRGSGVTDANPNPGGGNTGGNNGGGNGGGAQEVLKRVNAQTQTPLGKKIAEDFNKTAKQTGYVDPALKLAMEQQQQEQQRELALERDQEAERVQQENLTRAYQQMGANRDQYPQGPLSTFGDGSDILNAGSFEKEKTFGEDAWDSFKSGAGSAYDAVSSGASAVDDYLRYNPKDLTLASMAGSGYLRPAPLSNKPQDQVLPDSAESAYVAKPPLQLTRSIDAKNASTVVPDMSSQAAVPVETIVKPPINLSNYANASSKNPPVEPQAAPAVAPPAATSLKKEESYFGGVLNDIINKPAKTVVDLASNFFPATALYNFGGKALGWNSAGQSIQNLVNGQGAFDNPPEGWIPSLFNNDAGDVRSNMAGGADGGYYNTYGPYGNLSREEYQKQYGGKDVSVIPINTNTKTPTTPTTPDTTTETPTNGLGLATYDPRTYLGVANDPYNYGFGGEQVYYKAMGGAVGPLSQKRK